MADVRKALEEAQKRYKEYEGKGDSFGMEVENNNIVKYEQELKSAPYASNASTNTNSSPSSLLTNVGKSLVNAVNSYATNTPLQPQPQQSTNPLDIAPDPFRQAQSYTPPLEEPKQGLMWKENAPSQAAPTPVAPDPAPAPVPQPATLDWQSVYNNIKSMLPTYTPVKTLTWDEAMTRARAQLDPVYNERMDAADKNVEYNNLKTGFYGQLPGEVLKRETQIKENNARSAAIAGLANQLSDKSQSDAQQAEQMFMQKQNQDLNMIMNAIGIAQDQDNTKFNREQTAWNNEQTLKQYQRQLNNDAFDKAVTESNITGFYSPYSNVEIDPEAYKYDNLQAEINRRKATPDRSDDYLIPSLEGVRYKKVTGDPNSKYIGDYMTAAQKAQIAQNELKAAQNAWEQNPDNPDNIIKLNNALKAAEEAKQSAFETKNQSDMYGLDKAKKQLGLEESKASIAKTNAEIARTNALTANTYANTAKTKASAKNSDPFAGATEDQVWWYNQTFDKYLNPAKGMDEFISNPKKAYQYIAGDPKGFKALMGDKLYNQLLKQAGTTASKVGVTKTDNSANVTEAINGIASDLDSMTPKDAYNELSKYASDYIKDLGITQYNQLLNIYKNRVPKEEEGGY